MYSIKIVLRDNKKSSSGKRFQILYRFIRRNAVKNKSFEIASGYYVSSIKDFDKFSQEIVKISKLVTNKSKANIRLQRKKFEYIEKLEELDRRGELVKLSNKAVKNLLLEKYEQSEHNFCTWTDNIITRMKKQKRFGNAISYRSAKNFMMRYNGGKEIEFADITPIRLKRIEEQYIYNEGKSYNGLGAIYRSVRAVFNDAIKEGVIEEDLYPFNKYSIKTEKTKKRAISPDSLKKIESVEYEKNTQLWHAKQYFMFSFYCMGMNFADLGLLKKGDIVEVNIEGKKHYKISYRREKLKRYKKEIELYLLPEAMTILRSYGFAKKNENDFIFPIIERPESEILIRKDIKNKLSTFNKYIKRIQAELGIEQKLTSYVSRHSWASLARSKGYDLRVIGQALGHEDEKTTQIYVDSLETETIHEYNKNLLA